MIEVRRWSGGKITQSGVWSDVPIELYHGDICDGPSVSSSGLRTIFYESPAHYYRDSYLNPLREPQKVSDAFIFGRGCHHLLLGESDFRRFFVIRPETYPDTKNPLSYFDSPQASLYPQRAWSSAATWCKGWLLDAWMSDLTVLTQGDIKAIRGMAQSMAQEPLIQQGILNGLIEHSFFWQDEETGVWLKWRPDAIPTSDLAFADLKSTVSVRDEDLERAVGAYGYHAQAALGAEACRAVLGRDMDSFSLVFCEKAPPHCVRVKTVRPADVDLGVRQNRAAMRTFAKCVETGEWMGPGGKQHDAEYMGLTPWAYGKIESRITEMERQLA